jgi:acyl-[acyl-carrier-protein] desaturase
MLRRDWVFTQHRITSKFSTALLIEWEIGSVRDINEKAEKARDYLMALPARLKRIADRTRIPELQYEFSWIS